MSLDELLAGDRLDQYKILEEIGSGGMGTVYKALDTAIGRRRVVALKVFNPAMGSGSLERFLEEGEKIALLDAHPNIANVYTAGEDKGRHYIAMEFVEGETLRDIIDRTVGQGENLEVGYVLDIFKQVLSALQHAHSKKIVHRDINPNNIIITKDGQVKVLDFGIAKNFLADTDKKKTITGTELGTFSYFSPEQLRDASTVDGRSDIFSAGIVLYELLTGVKPYEQLVLDSETKLDYKTAVNYAIQTKKPALPSEYNDAIDKRLENIILKMLENDPERRYKEAGYALDDFNLYEQDGKVSASSYLLRRGLRSMRIHPVRPALALILTALLAWQGTAHIIERRAEIAERNAQIEAVRLEHEQYLASAEYSQSILMQTPFSQPGELLKNLKELKSRLYMQKIKQWFLEGKIPEGSFAFGVDEQGNWRCFGEKWSGGRDDDCQIKLLEGGEETGDSFFHEKTMEWRRYLTHDIRSMYDCVNERFLPGFGEEAYTDTTFRRVLVEAAEAVAAIYDPKLRIFAIRDLLGRINLRADSINEKLELPRDAAKHPEIYGSELDYADMVRNHRDTVVDLLFNPEGSINEMAIFNEESGKWELGDHFSPLSCDGARVYASAIQGLIRDYEETNNQESLEQACTCTDYYFGKLSPSMEAYMDISGEHPSRHPARDANVLMVANARLLGKYCNRMDYNLKAFELFFYDILPNINTAAQPDGILLGCTYLPARPKIGNLPPKSAEYENTSLMYADSELMLGAIPAVEDLLQDDAFVQFLLQKVVAGELRNQE